MCSRQYHEDQPLEVYCEDCKVLTCHECGVATQERHCMTDAQKATREQKMQMSDAVAKVKAEILVYENEIKKQTDLKNKNIQEIMNAEKKVTDTVEEIIRDLQEQEKKAKEEFRKIYEAEQKQHAKRLNHLQLIVTQLRSCVERSQGILERNISTEILQTNPTFLGRCNELLNGRKPSIYKSPYFGFLVAKEGHVIGKVTVSKTDPSMCIIEDRSGEERKESSFVIVTRDAEGLQCYQEDDQIKVDILTPEGDHLNTELENCRDGKYNVTYTPNCAGQYRVEVQVNGQPLIGSPCVIQVQHQYQFAFKFGSTGKRPGEFASIYDVAVSETTGTVAVADGGNRRIQLFSSDGKFQKEVKLDGGPISVAFTDCDDLLTLVSGGNSKLHLFSGEGQFIKHINDKHLNKPQHLSIASDARLILTDAANNEVKVLSPDGNDSLLSIVAPNCPKYPECAVYHKDKFYISYPGAHCIKVFNEKGQYLHDIGCAGSNDGQFCLPAGLIIDKYDQLIVCDENNGRLQLFSLSGKFLNKLQGHYFRNSSPRYAAVNNSNKLFVIDFSLRNCIHIFH
ncbi:E3 ubiquitin-protein ligase TRIM71-like [Acropora millepora]|uniref:E3 ubiquitin-protein ligase TRIM71-like n=1 Tax=Acropora millepora TaxID=45264 RepID=UPI001CF1FA72|nr:E3 ubiquitin-protein ligase TRIM71-like [Acropora millepora]